MSGSTQKASKDLIRRWFEEVWNKRNEKAVDEMLAEPCSVHGLGDEICCPDDFKRYHREMNAAISDIHMTVDKLVSEGEDICGIMTVSGVHRATGKPFTVKGAFLSTVRDGKIVNAENVIDFMPMFTAIGLMSEKSLADALTGGEL
ncbi:MAG: ester cyclase [Thermodesulfobacteriota bacterium]